MASYSICWYMTVLATAKTQIIFPLILHTHQAAAVHKQFATTVLRLYVLCCSFAVCRTSLSALHPPLLPTTTRRCRCCRWLAACLFDSHLQILLLRCSQRCAVLACCVYYLMVSLFTRSFVRSLGSPLRCC